MSVAQLSATQHPRVRIFYLLCQRIAVAVGFAGLLFLCALALFDVWSGTVEAARHGSILWTYPYSSYLIDYSAGFVRRGAIGTLIGFLTHGQRPLLFTSWMVFANYAALSVCVFVLILLNAKHKLATALLVFLLPSGIVMAGIMGGFFVWKESFFLTALAALGCGFNIIARLPSGAVQRGLGRTLIAVLLLFSAFASLAHESFIFLAAPAFAYLLIALIRISFGLNRRETTFATWYMLVLLGMFLVLGFLFHGTSAQVSRIWQHVNPLDRAMYAPGKYGDIEQLGHSAGYELNDIVHLITCGFTWWYLAPLALFFIYCTAVACVLGGRSRGWSVCYLVIAICTVPMFVLAVDYGRWVMMIQMTFLITLLSLGRERLATIRIFPVRMSSLEGKLDHLELFFDNLVQRHLVIVTGGLLLFTLTFRMPLLFITDPLGANPEGAFPAALVYTLRSLKHLH